MIMIGLLFGICVAMLYGLALITGASYNDVSVAINIFVEPAACLLLMAPALLAILRKDKEAKTAFKVFKYAVYVLVVIGFIGLAYSGYWFLQRVDSLQGFSVGQVFSYNTSQWTDYARQVETMFPTNMYSPNHIFTYIRDNLICLSARLGMTYEALNILIYVVAELLSLGMLYLAYKLQKGKIAYFAAGVIFFIVSIIPTLYLISTSAKEHC